MIYTYIMGDNSGYVKIGRSKDPEKRLKQLSTANPTIKLLFEHQGDIENRLHKLYSFQNLPTMGKEWFDLTQEQIEKLVFREHFELYDADSWEDFIWEKSKQTQKK